MAFTYDLTTNRGKVRLRLSDTNALGYVFEDNEIDYFLTVGSTVVGAVVEGLKVLLVDRARRSKFFTLQGVTLDDRGAVQSIQAAISEYGGLPTVSVTFPAVLPMDLGYDSSNP